MKITNRLYMLSVFLSAVSSANAGLRVWQTAVPQSPGAFVDNEGLGARLDLRCDVSALPCKWRVTTQVLIEDGNMTGYTLSIIDPAGSETDLNLSNTSVTGSPFSDVLLLQENPPNWPGYLVRISASIPGGVGPVPPSIQFMHSYDLTMVAGQIGNITDLIGDTAGFFGFDPAFPSDGQRRVQMAANPSLQFGPWHNPVIRINHVPEPASLSLLACGLVLLGRRKQRRD